MKIFRSFLLGLLASGGLLAAEDVQSRPNIIIMMSDDMGWADVSYHGSEVQTPNIDQMGQDGVRLERFYVFPICSPTRTALMTARSPIRSGILSPIGDSGGVPTEERFLPKSFQKSGYQTWCVGKWHLGRGEGHGPRDRGFDHFYGFLGGSVDYYKHSRGRGLDWQRNGVTIDEKGYSTDLLAKEAISLLETRDKEKPVFLTLTFNAPHSPFRAPREFVEAYEQKGYRGQMAIRAASITAMDAAIGRVLKALDEEGMAGDTVVLFFCDNGAGSRSQGRRRGEQGVGDSIGGNAPLKRGKGGVYEGGIRVPAVMRWPGVIDAGSQSDAFVSILDVLPSFAALGEVALNPTLTLDGVNMWPTIVGEKPAPKDRSIVVASERSRAVLQDPWKLVEEGGTSFLYDVRKDPGEADNLFAEQGEIAQRLQKVLAPYLAILEESDGGNERRRGRRGEGRRRFRGTQGSR